MAIDLDTEQELEYIRQRRIMKDALNDIIKEWMDAQFKMFGKWTLRAVAVVVFSVLIHLLLVTNPKVVHEAVKAAVDSQ